MVSLDKIPESKEFSAVGAVAHDRDITTQTTAVGLQELVESRVVDTHTPVPLAFWTSTVCEQNSDFEWRVTPVFTLVSARAFTMSVAAGPYV